MPSNATRFYMGTMRDIARLGQDHANHHRHVNMTTDQSPPRPVPDRTHQSGAQPTSKQKPNTTARPDTYRGRPTADHSRPQSLCESGMPSKATGSYRGTTRENARLVQGRANHHRHVNKTTDQSTARPVHDHLHQ
ncbi:hypothetical protein U1Q18_049140 [Sarracenia purpurea var. burkii]